MDASDAQMSYNAMTTHTYAISLTVETHTQCKVNELDHVFVMCDHLYTKLSCTRALAISGRDGDLK